MACSENLVGILGYKISGLFRASSVSFIRVVSRDGDRAGPLAAIFCEPRQARKGATVAEDSSAGVRLA